MRTPFFQALQNMDADFQVLLSRFGVDVVAVMLPAEVGSATWKDPNIAKSLGEELERAKAGRFDSCMMMSGPYYGCFYHVHNLGNGVAALKRALEVRGLLKGAGILVAEPEEKKMRFYWPQEAADTAQVI